MRVTMTLTLMKETPNFYRYGSNDGGIYTAYIPKHRIPSPRPETIKMVLEFPEAAQEEEPDDA